MGVGRGRKKGSASGGLFQSDLHSRLVHSHCDDSKLQRQFAAQNFKIKTATPFLPPHPLQNPMIY